MFARNRIISVRAECHTHGSSYGDQSAIYSQQVFNSNENAYGAIFQITDNQKTQTSYMSTCTNTDCSYSRTETKELRAVVFKSKTGVNGMVSNVEMHSKSGSCGKYQNTQQGQSVKQVQYTTYPNGGGGIQYYSGWQNSSAH